ncbi:phosphate:acyl-[acyl carrier protein] acyltransferase [Salsuginibacillus halophilus]|uniref:Phosphate acyltransferase n=1 Tax=Salsuginibacillus halophilus TaxID=517424 RepID=A0A2P8HYA9_9BACI|nr:phosphate acyltransferase PlsX [Salsuginibacillus halophilus]PSL51155.1 phosphate:acyl-[acyl carrier protein] acyltransferase [Salsuginibacillus halophilus]
MKLAIDVMGGDNAPKAQIAGAIAAVKTFEDLEVLLVGKEEMIREHMSDQPRITIIHAEETIEGDDNPTRAVRRKKDASLVVAMRLVREGEADACVSAGNTGALMTAGLLHIGRLDGIDRPALAPMLPTVDGQGFLLLDVGANVDAKAEHLAQYARMGRVYMEKVQKREAPSVGLLNVGSETGKGNELTKSAYELLEGQSHNFAGNVEARELLEGAADVVVADGFSGNLVLKSIEGTAGALFSILKQELTSSVKNKLAAGVLKPSFQTIRDQMNYAQYGGAGLFGLQAPVVKAHGSSDHTAVYHALRQAREMVLEDVCGVLKREIENDELKETDA